MKYYLSILLFCCIAAFSVNVNNDVARVNTYKSKLLFIECIPVEPYRIIETNKKRIFIFSPKTINEFYEPAIDWGIKNKIDFDGLLYLDNDMQFIKFS